MTYYNILEHKITYQNTLKHIGAYTRRSRTCCLVHDQRLCHLQDMLITVVVHNALHRVAPRFDEAHCEAEEVLETKHPLVLNRSPICELFRNVSQNMEHDAPVSRILTILQILLKFHDLLLHVCQVLQTTSTGGY